jgi:hypothetical protein
LQAGQALAHPSESRANLVSELREWAGRCIELLHRIDDAEHGDAIVTLEEHDVARQEQPRTRIELDGFERKGRITSTEDPVPTEVGPELGLESLLEIDLRDDAETFGLERSRQAFSRLIEADAERTPSSAMG